MPTPVAASRRRFAPAPHPSPPRAWANAERWPKTRASCLPMTTSRRKRTELQARDRHQAASSVFGKPLKNPRNDNMDFSHVGAQKLLGGRGSDLPPVRDQAQRQME